VQQRFRLLQIERVEAFGKPVVDRSEKIAGIIFWSVQPTAAWLGTGLSFASCTSWGTLCAPMGDLWWKSDGDFRGAAPTSGLKSRTIIDAAQWTVWCETCPKMVQDLSLLVLRRSRSSLTWWSAGPLSASAGHLAGGNRSRRSIP